MSVNNVMIAAASVQRLGCVVRLPLKSDSLSVGTLATPLGRSAAAAAAVTRSIGRCLSACGHRQKYTHNLDSATEYAFC